MLLQNFLVQKLKDYKEPIRKGTPRGEPVGLCKAKYTMTLLMLYNNPLKTASIKGHVSSYGLLRKWQTEDVFNKMVEAHSREFGKLVAMHLRRRAKRQHQLLMEYYNLPLKTIASTPPPLLSHKEFMDSKHYSPILMKSIVEAIFQDMDFSQDAINDDIIKNGLIDKSEQPIPEKYEKSWIELRIRLYMRQINYLLDLLDVSIWSATDYKQQMEVAKKSEITENHERCEFLRKVLSGKSDVIKRKIALAMVYMIEEKHNLVDMPD
jgi:hypothetical protein